MAIVQQPPRKSMRERMPPNYLPELVKRTGMSTNTIFRVVKHEQKTSKAWPAVLKLAKEYEKQLEEERQLGVAS